MSLFDYSATHTVLSQPMFGVGSRRCKNAFASRAASLACRPYLTVLLCYCPTISLHIQYCRGRCLGLATRDAKNACTSGHLAPRAISGSHRCMSAPLTFTVLVEIGATAELRGHRTRRSGLSARTAQNLRCPVAHLSSPIPSF